MVRALDAARRGRAASPNPMVGAVLARGEEVLASGWHDRFGGPHAERRLLDRLDGGREIPADAILYLTLEPCAHTGKTPPCVDALLSTPIRRFVVAARDPNPLVAGKGIRRLRAAGREVRVGLLGEAARALNAAYTLFHREGRASVALKLASSLDGRLADAWADSQWITGPPARREVRRIRSRSDAVVIGRGTLLRDDPRLDGHAGPGPSAGRILLDSRLRSDPDCRMARLWRKEVGSLRRADGPARGNWLPPAQPGGAWRRRPRLIVASCRPSRSRAARFREAGWEIWELPERGGRIDLGALAVRAGREGLLDLLVEAGPTLAAALLEEGPVDRLLLFLAPVILGGPAAWSARLAPRRIGRPIRALPAREAVRIGGDLLWEFTGIGGRPLVPIGRRGGRSAGRGRSDVHRTHRGNGGGRRGPR